MPNSMRYSLLSVLIMGVGLICTIAAYPHGGGLAADG